MDGHLVISFSYDDVAMKLGLALGVGILIGLEREWSQKEAGVRTFAITALLGTLTALASICAVLLAFGSIALLVVLMNVQSIFKRKSLEITTSVTLMVTLTLGVLIGQDHYFTATSAALLLASARLPFTTSIVSSTLYYWWLDSQGEQDTPVNWFHPKQQWVVFYHVANSGFVEERLRAA